MIDYAAIHARLDAKIAQAHQKKVTAKQPENSKCPHNWQMFKQTVVPERPIEDRVPAFLGTGAYFKIRGCLLCKAKQYIDYVVER